jgi:hypothetical protein
LAAFHFRLPVGLIGSWSQAFNLLFPSASTQLNSQFFNNSRTIYELAFAPGCRYIVTHNMKDFHSLEQLGVTALSPREYLNLIGKKS